MQRKSTSDKEAANLKAGRSLRSERNRGKSEGSECGVRQEWERMRLKRWLGG